MTTFPALPPVLRAQLAGISASHDYKQSYWPCRALLRDGAWLPRVLMCTPPDWALVSQWRPPPNISVDVRDIVALEESPERLPASFADDLYEIGESGMGYYVFRLFFHDGRRADYVTSTMLDFVRYPDGLGPGDVVRCEADVDRTKPLIEAPDFKWCFFDGGWP